MSPVNITNNPSPGYWPALMGAPNPPSPQPFTLTLYGTDTGASDFAGDVWLNLVNQDDPNGGLIIDYYEYDAATRLRFAPLIWGSGQGFVVEYAPSENILIFGGVYGAGQYPVSTYFDGSTVLHLGELLATDGQTWVFVAAPTAGSITWHMPFGGANYKKLLISFNAFENDTASNFVHNLTAGGYGENYIVGFSTIATVTFNNTGLTVSISGTTVTVTTTDSVTTYSGLVVIEGY